MSVQIEQENVSPKNLLSSPSNCMVVKGGTIPASPHSFPGMEHDRSIFNGQSQEPPSNGITQLIGSSDSFDDEREIEAAAAASEQISESPVRKLSVCVETSNTEPPFGIPPENTSVANLSQTFSPLHINVNDCSKIETSSRISCDSDLSKNGSSSVKKTFPPSSLRMPHEPSTSSTLPPIIMGPPSSTNTQVLLSPAGNFHNGYQRMSSGDSSPSAIIYSSRQKGMKQSHPLAAQRSITMHYQRSYNNSNFGAQVSRPPSSLASPSGSGRKDHEMTRRRALVDRITKSRGPDYVHLLPQTEGLSNTQTSILLRKHRGTLISEGMPYSLQKLIDCGAEPDKTAQLFVEKIKEANKKRIAHTDLDELTDVSDVEDNEEDLNTESQGRKSPKNVPRWTPKRMRFCGMLSRTEALLREKKALMGMLKTQKAVMNCSSGVRFVGEEMIPRRRRQLNGMYFLYDKSAFRRTPLNYSGCARTLPIQSWTRRNLQNDIFETSTTNKSSDSGPAVVKPSSNPSEKWVATGQYNTVSYLTNGEKREITEYNYEEYKSGEGIQRVNELSSMDPIDFVASSEFTPFEDRQMAYMYRLSTAPSNVIRKKHGKSIYFEAEERRAIEQNVAVKKKSDKKKERKPVEEASSDECDGEETKEPTKKRPRGRPVASKRKASRATASASVDHGMYVDYLFDDYMNEDICTKQLPNKITYAVSSLHSHRRFNYFFCQSITVPHWYKISDDYWDDVPSSKVGADDLLTSVAKQHHRLMHAERDRIKRDTEKRNRNRQTALKSAAATPAHNTFNEDNGDNDGFPPFDMKQFEPGLITSRRIFASVETPYQQRDFLSNHSTQSSK
uniref:SAM domain-containing protein n=1 Tax=Caenorhabditis tropicalis TaxID=1561998 RepID=A0A1I7TMF6_9PELO